MPDQPEKPTSWMIRGEGQQRAIASVDELKAAVASGTLKAEHYVYHPQKQQWLYANQVPELRDAFVATTHDPDAWVVNLRGQTYALKSLDEVRKWIDDYRIDPATKIRNPKLARWMTAADVPELQPSFNKRPVIQFDSSDADSPSLLRAILIGAFAAFVVLGFIFFLRSRTATTLAPPPPTATIAAPAETAAPVEEAQPRPRKIHTITFGKDGKEITTSTSTDTTTATATDTSATTVTAAPAAVATSTHVATPAPTPPRPAVRDEAEADDYDDEDVAVRGNDAIRVAPSGDTLVVIDRSGRDRFYHRPGCPAAKGELQTVSLDLAKQAHSPDPQCKPPS
jgi:hypothetical protein